MAAWKQGQLQSDAPFGNSKRVCKDHTVIIAIYVVTRQWTEISKNQQDATVAVLFISKKVKVKAFCGSYSTAALRHIVLLPKWVPLSISRGAAHTKRR